MTNLKINKLYPDTQVDLPNPYFDLRIHSFHKIPYLGNEIIESDRQTYRMVSLERIIVKCGFSIELEEDCSLFIFSRMAGAIKDGLMVFSNSLVGNGEGKEIEVLLYNSSDGILLLQKGYRIARAVIIKRESYIQIND